MKAFADRDRDWIDVEGVIIRQQNRLDWSYINQQLDLLCRLKEAPQIPLKLKALRNKPA